MSEIGFIGCGIMGGPIVANLVKAGHTVKAIGRSQASKQRITQANATEVQNYSEISDGSDYVITMLPDSPDVKAVVQGTGGLNNLLQPGQVFIDMSTISPEVAREIASTLQDEGVETLDAPVSGGQAAAEDGALSIMVGGSQKVFESAQPLFTDMGSSIIYVGPSGSGQLTKAANQLIVAANIQAVAEAIVLLESAGVRLEAALEAISSGLAGSTVLERKRRAFLSNDFTPGFRLELHDKDMKIVQSTAKSQGNYLPLTNVATQMIGTASVRGQNFLDHSALLNLARDMNP